MRDSWEVTWIEVAHAIAGRSLCVRDQVGAVIVDANQRIVATGYNGPPSGFCHNEMVCDAWCPRSHGDELSRDYSDCVSLHAEANAISAARLEARQDATLYVTSHVCFGCAKLIANSGVAHAVVHATDSSPHRNPAASYELLRSCGIAVTFM